VEAGMGVEAEVGESNSIEEEGFERDEALALEIRTLFFGNLQEGEEAVTSLTTDSSSSSDSELEEDDEEYVADSDLGSGVQMSSLSFSRRATSASLGKRKRHPNPQHHRIHDVKKRESKLYTCTIPGCDKVYRHSSSLRDHMHAHSDVKRPYACTLCDWAFSERSNLQRHMRGHAGEKPFACRVCKRAFAQKSNMQTHMLRLHGENCRLAKRSKSKRHKN